MATLALIVLVPVVFVVQLVLIVAALVMVAAGVRYFADLRAGMARPAARARFCNAWAGIWTGDLRRVEPVYLMPVLALIAVGMLLAGFPRPL